MMITRLVLVVKISNVTDVVKVFQKKDTFKLTKHVMKI